MSRITGLKQVEQEITIGYQCDVCKKQVENVPKDWHEFNHHHNAWGNDSIHSYEYFNVCSVDCYIKQLSESINRMDGRYGAEIDGMPLGFAKSLLAKLQKQ